jgi:hypothetical protein
LSVFYGLPTGILENDHIRLEYLTTAGPRVVRFSLRGRSNLLAELPEVHTETPDGMYYFRGGHRLWVAPETMSGTYRLDNDGVTVDEFPGGVRLTGPRDPVNGIVKIIEVQLVPDQPSVILKHEIRNQGLHPVDLAPWALTMLPLGGLAILPQPTLKTDALGFLHNRILALWPYTHINDPRLILRDDVILIRAVPQLPPIKVGYFNQHGWLAYWFNGNLFRETFNVHADLPHVDGGCNAEVFCDNRFVELESLGAFVTLNPGNSAFLTDTWELWEGLEGSFLTETTKELIAGLVNPDML